VTASVPGESNPDAGRKSVEQKRGQRYPRSIRLLRHADFERVYKQGRRHFSASLTVFYLQRQLQPEAKTVPAEGLRVGFTVSRALGGAVQRNRMRRRLREAVRLCRPAITPNVDVVINPKKVVLTAEFESLLNEVRRAFVVIGKATTQYPVPSTEPKPA
jgi:ribonuclease P protein component